MQWYVRHLTAVAVAVLATQLAAFGAERAPELKPHPATVTVPGAAVRSGPGESYYLTDTLPEETDVEVYQRRPDGWCAIRPPADSFSWVFAQHVRIIGDGVAEIEKEDVAARVGSRLCSQRDVVQVRLHKGESVAILGRDERDGGLWCKIAPPAGEFRWVRAEDIGLGGSTAQPAESVSNDVRTASIEEPIEDKKIDIEPPPLASAETAPPAAADDQWTAAKGAAPKTTGPSPTSDITPIGPGSATSANLSEHLSDLEIRLSRMVAEPPTTWNIGPLEQTAEQLLSRADTVADREAVKVTLAKIDRFAAIQRRYAATAATGEQPTTGVSSRSESPVGGSQAAPSSPYDAVGILRPVVSRRPGAPQFALVNAEGQVVTFVTPSPDVNLQPYVGQRVGVTGSRGYIPEFRRAHVTAGRVAPLNERMLR